MADRPHKDDRVDDNQTSHCSLSLAGNIKSQPISIKGNKTWQPMQVSDLGEYGTVDGGGSSASLPFDDTERIPDVTVTSDSSYLFESTKFSTYSHTPSDRGQSGYTRDGTRAVENIATFPQPGNEVICQSEVRYSTGENLPLLFVNLPDLIRLSEQPGKFDGQVVFIGHPNRDISAHQWSSSSFQWANIGRYSNARGKVEGSLASDRLRGIGAPHDTLEYFKLAAENRQTLVTENGRSKDHTTIATGGLHLGMNVIASTQICRDALAKDARVTAQTQSEMGPFLPSTACNPFAKEVLEDPFVAASIPDPSDGDQDQSNWIGSTGSLDLTYKFPTKATLEKSLVTERGAFSVKSAERLAPTSLSRSTLPGVALDKEAASQRETSSTNDRYLQPFPTNVAYQRFRGRLQIPSDVEESRSTLPIHDGLTSSAAILDPATRYNVPTHSFAPDTYMTSGLNATAMPYAKLTTATAGSGISESSGSTVNAAEVGLRYSDPDGLRTKQQYEVTNGLNQQAPTLQSFKGPFFTESKPTTHDPTVALSVRVSEEEKLVNWFRDGHRPARQIEYTKSLIAAAAASGKTRYLGAIGEAPSEQERGPYANTAPFVRLYENLSEYVEEYRSRSGESYFTRRWKPGAPHLREVGPDNKASYFSKRSVCPRWPKLAMFRRAERRWG